MTADPSAEWAEEIRTYLLGRMSRMQAAGVLPEPKSAELVPPVLRWWVFEGKRYRGVAGPLAGAWAELALRFRALLATFNPRLRVTDHPDGNVDWPRTLARAGGKLSEYVTAASATGLSEAELQAVQGWVGWIAGHWRRYAEKVGLPNPGRIDALLACGSNAADGSPASRERLRTWAHTTRRSRWPLLRDVVAESLRCELEPEELDKLPLPTDRAALFELLCLVRIAAHVSPFPGDIRWVDAELSGNAVVIPGATLRYQLVLGSDAVRATLTEPGLRAGVEQFGVRVPDRIDVLCEFPPTPGNMRGITGILVEAKSGAQEPSHALGQLRVYRETLSRRLPGRILVWGIAEQSSQGYLRDNQIEWIGNQVKNSRDDLWVFSTADDISRVLKAVETAGC